MFCMNCGSKIATGDKFCPICGKAVDEWSLPQKTNTQLHWILIFLSIGLLLLSLLLALNLEDPIIAKEVILPAILSLVSLGLAGYVFMDTKNKPELRNKHILSLIVLLGGILLAVELCIGPLLGTILE